MSKVDFFLFNFLSLSLSIYLSIYLSFYLPIYLSLSLSLSRTIDPLRNGTDLRCVSQFESNVLVAPRSVHHFHDENPRRGRPNSRGLGGVIIDPGLRQAGWKQIA